MSEITAILARMHQGDARAADELAPLICTELRKLASSAMALQPPGQTLQPTALVHEAWLKLTGSSHTAWNDHGHFLRAAAEAMRQILIDRARARARLKRGGDRVRVELDEVDIATEAPPEALLLVDEALERLEREHPDKAELVKLRFYAGLSIAETAQALGVSEKTVNRHWTHARAWLFREIKALESRE